MWDHPCIQWVAEYLSANTRSWSWPSACTEPIVCFLRSFGSSTKQVRRSWTWQEEAHPGDRTGPNPARKAASAPAAPRCDVTASNSTHRSRANQPGFFFSRQGMQSFLPRYARVETRYAGSAISILSRDHHLPYNLRITVRGNFHDLRRGRSVGKRFAHRKLHISVAEYTDAATPKSVETW